MKKVKIFGLSLIILASIGFTANNICTHAATVMTGTTQSAVQYTSVNALDVVASPNRYLHRNIRIKAKFDKFSTLGLDYPAAMRSSDKYISFLIQRPDSAHNIPLSELKVFLKKEVAEKHIDLDAGDEIEFTGKVFSTALGDPWVDVDNFTVLTQKAKKTETKKSE